MDKERDSILDQLNKLNNSTSLSSPSKIAKNHPWYLWGAFLLVVVLIVFQNFIILSQEPTVEGKAIDFGRVTACVNLPPSINLGSCNWTAFVDTPYYCTLNGSDPHQTQLHYGINVLSGNPNGTSLFTLTGPDFDLTDNNLNFTANSTQVGDYIMLVTINDRTDCENSITTYVANFSILENNNTPYLVQPIPNQTWPHSAALVAFNLNNYFADPNNDPLAYSVSGNTNIGISITPGGSVLMTPAQSWCGVETVIFQATDPTNLSAFSNQVFLNVTCPPPSTGSTTGSSGGGGGGGGGRVAQPYCAESYSCLDWSVCQLTRRVTRAGASLTEIVIEGVAGERTYTPAPGAPYEFDDYYTGFQWRLCVDINLCPVSKERVEVRPCEYRPSCFDGIQNQDETAVDCGGSICGPCNTCSDGIQNGLEEGIDCGGPFCEACNSCTNGKMDGLETGLDCGGPDCPACNTCFDGIRNGLETGVDCGGPFCSACAEEQFPAAGFPWLTFGLIALVVLIGLLIILVVLKKQIASALMALLLRHKKTNRRILLSSDLKADIIERLDKLDKRIEAQPILKSQEELARIIRDYFKYALGLEFEFTNEELISALKTNKLNPLLAQIMQKFFARINVLEFSGIGVDALVLRALVQETKELVFQTAVLTVDDLKAREGDLKLREVPKEAPGLDRGYLLLSQLHLTIQFGKIELAQALYQVLQSWYNKAPVTEQRAIYEDLARVYDELRLAMGASKEASKANK